MDRTSRTEKRRWSVVAPVLALLLAALTAPVAEAAFPGKAGPIAYSTSFADGTEFSGGIFAHGPRVKDRAKRLTEYDGDTSPSYSADGRSIAFAANREPPATSSGRSSIYLMDADGGNVRRLTSGENYDSNPAFSPDGSRVVFDRAMGTSRTPHIFVVNADGSGLRQLTSGTSADYEPTFTPNGRRIIFVSNRRSDREKNRSAIFAMGPDGSNQRVLIDTPRNEGEPDVSPNGRRIVFVTSRDGGQNIYVADANGRRMHPLLKPVSSCIRRSCYGNPVWSPDEKHIAALYSGTYGSALHVLRADGRGFSKTFASGGTEEEGYGTRIGAPSWGPAPR